MAQMQAIVAQVPGMLRDFRQTRLSAIRPVQEFFDVQKVSRPQDLNDATRRISHNTRHFGGNYSLVVALVSVYALITNPLLIIAIGFLFGGFVGINKFVPEPSVSGDSGPVTQKQAYTVLFVVGIPLLWLASPVSTIAYVVGLSAIVILGHASMLEPGVESEYGNIETV